MENKMLIFKYRHHKTNFYPRTHAIEKPKKDTQNHKHPNSTNSTDKIVHV